MAQGRKYLFGPIPSRRLGLSLGVDVVPFKVCTLDCVYCQLGGTTEKTIERKEYVPAEAVIAELKVVLAEGVKADFITVGGSGEPTLNSALGEIIKGIKQVTEIPVAVLTNGTLFYDSRVRADCCGADVVLPSLDAGDDVTFEKVNRPHRDISTEKLVEGLCAFRREFEGEIWLEVFVVDALNTGAEQIAKIKEAIARIGADKIQINTAVRPTAEAGIEQVGKEKLESIAQELGPNCEVVADFSVGCRGKHFESTAECVLSMLGRRPCSLEDICAGLGLGRNEVLKYTSGLEQQGAICSETKGGKLYFRVRR